MTTQKTVKLGNKISSLYHPETTEDFSWLTWNKMNIL